MLEKIMSAYLYTNYMDDDNIRPFFDAYNEYAQGLYDWCRNANLPVFVGADNSGDQLKWIAKGIYGQDFPILNTTKSASFGPFNRLRFGQLPVNGRRTETVSNQVSTSDDVFRRIMTWNFYRGDGYVFSVPWLKRRVKRFLLGVNGVDIDNDQQWDISVLFDGSDGIAITVFKTYMTLSSGALYNVPQFDDSQFNEATLTPVNNTGFKYAEIFKTVFENGLLHMPFWAKTTVNIIG